MLLDIGCRMQDGCNIRARKVACKLHSFLRFRNKRGHTAGSQDPHQGPHGTSCDNHGTQGYTAAHDSNPPIFIYSLQTAPDNIPDGMSNDMSDRRSEYMMSENMSEKLSDKTSEQKNVRQYCHGGPFPASRVPVYNLEWRHERDSLPPP